MRFKYSFQMVVQSTLLCLSLTGAAQATELTQLPGSPVRSIDQLHGKVVVIDFWASWCGPCRKSFPWFNQMQHKYQDQGLVILAVNEDEDKTDADKFLAQFPASFAVLFDQAGEVASQYQLQGMPTTLLLDRQGRVRFTHSGFFEGKTAAYEQEIQQLLQEDHKP